MLVCVEPLSQDKGMNTTNKPAGNSFPVLRQLCNLIPRPMFDELCGRYGFDTRGYSEWSHFVTMLYAHLSRAASLNEVCDGLRMHAAALACVKGAVPPSKNNLSNCNKRRDAAFMEELYWLVMEFLCRTNSGFGSSKCRKGYLRRFRKAIHAVDSTTVKLVAKNLGWAKHRRRKAAAKVHMRVGLQGFLPKFAGRYGRDCSSTCSCGSWRGSRSGGTPSPASRPLSGRRSGSDGICARCCALMGQRRPPPPWLQA